VQSVYGLAHGAVSYDILNFLKSSLGSSTTSGGALVGTFLSGSVWSNRSQLTYMEYRVSFHFSGRLSL